MSPIISTLNVQAVGTFSTPLGFCQITRRHNTEERRRKLQVSPRETQTLQLHLSGITNNKILAEYQRYRTTEIIRFQIDVIIVRRREREREREEENETGKYDKIGPRRSFLERSTLMLMMMIR